jgi:AraC family transcriptional regulator
MATQTIQSQPERITPRRFLDSGTKSDLLRVVLQADDAGVIETSGMQNPLVAIHVGRPVRMECKHGNRNHTGLAIHGDIDIIPRGIRARWEMKETDTALLLRLSPELLRRVAEDAGFPTNGLEIRDRFQIRDPQIEHIGWALKVEVEQGYPTGHLYMESMATSLALLVLRNHSSATEKRSLPDAGLPTRRLKQVLCYIEDNLSEPLSLQTVADVAGLSVSHLKVVFRRSVGMPVHQYVIRRRVERAAFLLRQGAMPISQVALETGFAHQSHLAMHMRRVLRISPKHLAKFSRIS